jgi:prophage regulatory protein
MHRTGLTCTQVYDGQDAGTFPRSVTIGARAVAWVEAEVDAWIAERIKARDAGSPEQARERRWRKGGPGRGHRGPRGLKEPVRIETT